MVRRNAGPTITSKARIYGKGIGQDAFDAIALLGILQLPASNYRFGRAIATDGDGRIYVTGGIYNGSNYDMAIWKFLPNGSPDVSFDNDGVFVHHGAAGGNNYDEGSDISIHGNKVYVSGFSSGVNQYDKVVWRLLANGALDSSFGTQGYISQNNAAGGNSFDYGRAIFVTSDESIYVTGSSRGSG